jgi:quinol monooxygenase YgiN
MGVMTTFDSPSSASPATIACMKVTRRTLLMGFGGAVLVAGCARSGAARVPEKGADMVVEYIRYEIAAERRDAFIAAYRDAAKDLAASKHCRRYEVTQCTEDAASFVVRIEWDSVEGHMQGFRKEKEFPPFFAKVKPFFDDIKEMRHYALTDVVSAR